MAETSVPKASQDTPFHDEFRAWVGYEVLAPLVILVLAWAIAQYVLDLENAFLSTFGSGDLLPVAALILLGGSAEIDNYLVYEAKVDDRRALSKHRLFQILLVLVIAIVFGALKGKALLLLDQNPLGPANKDKLLEFSRFTIGLTIFAVVCAYYSKNKLLSIRIANSNEG